MEYNNDFKYDLILGQMGERFIGKLLTDQTLEVKFDFECYRTGNFYIEYSSRGKPSGIATTTAKYWSLIAASEHGRRLKDGLDSPTSEDILFSILIETERLKDLCRNKYERMDVRGGDSDTSIGVLIKAKNLL
jgi:hypothetical protein